MLDPQTAPLNTIDTAIRQAKCGVMVMKLGKNLLVDRPNSEYLTQNSALEAMVRLHYVGKIFTKK